MQFIGCAFLVVSKKSEYIGNQLDSKCVIVGRSISNASSDKYDRNNGLGINVCLEDQFSLFNRA